MAKDQFAALPASEQQDANGDQRQQQAFRRRCRWSFTVSRVKAVQLNQDHNHVPAGVPPRVIERTNALVAENIN